MNRLKSGIYIILSFKIVVKHYQLHFTERKKHIVRSQGVRRCDVNAETNIHSQASRCSKLQLREYCQKFESDYN